MTSLIAPVTAHQHNSAARASPSRRIIAAALVWVVKLLVKTFRVTFVGPEPALDVPTVFAFHHGRQMGLLRHPRPEKTVVLTSLSHDGALQAMVLSALGFDVVRGSTSRGGDVGLVGVVRAVRGGAAAALAVDGPRGPMGVVKPGALFVARAARGVVIPVTCAASRAWRLVKSWDHFLIPAPWSRVVVVRGQPIAVEDDRGNESLEGARSKLERDLIELGTKAETLARGGQGRVG